MLGRRHNLAGLAICLTIIIFPPGIEDACSTEIDLGLVSETDYISYVEDLESFGTRYYDTNGKLVKNYLEKPLRLNPLATAEYLVEQKRIDRIQV